MNCVSVLNLNVFMSHPTREMAFCTAVCLSVNSRTESLSSNLVDRFPHGKCNQSCYFEVRRSELKVTKPRKVQTRNAIQSSNLVAVLTAGLID